MACADRNRYLFLFRFVIKMAAVLTAFMPPFDRLRANGECHLENNLEL